VNVVFHPRVAAEVDAIMRYYEEVADSRLADDFYQEFRVKVLEVAENLEHFNERLGGYKRANLRRFPYNFLFRETEAGIRILVVRHHARNPRYGGKRK
jgi:plasmid stabilization system protein ParE